MNPKILIEIKDTALLDEPVRFPHEEKQSDPLQRSRLVNPFDSVGVSATADIDVSVGSVYTYSRPNGKLIRNPECLRSSTASLGQRAVVAGLKRVAGDANEIGRAVNLLLSG